MRARFYNSGLRRFLNGDPIGFNGGMNWYGYAGADPVRYGDPFGRDVVYLLDADAVGLAKWDPFWRSPAGHGALMVGNDRSGWTYFSYGPGPDDRNGNTRTTQGRRDTLDNLNVVSFHGKTFTESIAEVQRRIVQGDSTIHHKTSVYDSYVGWRTDAQQDQAAVNSAIRAIGTPYNLLSWNCDDVATTAIRAAGVPLKDAWYPAYTPELNSPQADFSGGLDGTGAWIRIDSRSNVGSSAAPGFK